MFGIRPVKTLIVLGVLFLFFTATKIDKKSSLDKNKTQPMSHYMEKTAAYTKPLTAKDAINILHYLFKEKIHDNAMNCHAKKAKTRWFIKCQKGQLIKDNYWEVTVKNKSLKLLARSSAALYIVDKYQFRELTANKTKIDPKVEKALINFFN